MANPNCYLIWSNEHGRWWAPDRRGYTAIIGEAGRYSEAEAREICARANQYRPEGAEPHEGMVLAPEAIPEPEDEPATCEEADGCPTEGARLRREWRQMRARIAALERANQRLREALAPFIREAQEWADAIGDDSMLIAIGHWNDIACDHCRDNEVDGLQDAQFTLGDLRRLLALAAENENHD
jgi:hypothetical protein